MAEQIWHSIHFSYYDVDKDSLILDCIRPLLTTLSRNFGVQRVYFTRHWQRGPHLRLHVYAEPDYFKREIAPLVMQEGEAYLRECPSRGSFTEEEARRQFARRSHLVSGEQSVYLPPIPNNTLCLAPYDLETRIMVEDATTYLEDYYVETNELVFTVIEQTRKNYTARLNACFDQLIAFVAAITPLPMKIAYMSYRSHVEAYIVGEAEVENPVLRRQRFAQAFQERHDVIVRRIERVLQSLETSSGHLAPWLPAMIETHRRYYEILLQNVLQGSIVSSEGEEMYQYVDDTQRFRLGASSFHAAVAQSKASQELSKHPRVFANRLLLNFLYLHLNRTGMLNEDRYLLDYYIAEAFEEMFHLSPVDMILNYQGSTHFSPTSSE